MENHLEHIPSIHFRNGCECQSLSFELMCVFILGKKNNNRKKTETIICLIIEFNPLKPSSLPQ